MSEDTQRVAMASGFTALPAGTRVDRYEIKSMIAAGGFGITYLAEHSGLGVEVALKEHFPRDFAFRDGGSLGIRPTNPETFSWTRERFLSEGRALIRCKHPGVVAVTDVFEANGTAYMALGYEKGQSLGQWLRSLGRLPTQDELDQLLAPLLDALAYVHSTDMLHRDLAPDNIIVRTDDSPVLIDFGAARQAIAQRSQIMSAIVKGGYSPPEQYTSTGRSQGPWSDIYALGATLYAALTGRPPDESTQRTIDDDYVALAEKLGDASGHYRPAFLAAIDQALKIPRNDRPQTVAQWRGDLFRVDAPSGEAAPSVDIVAADAPTVLAPLEVPSLEVPSAPKTTADVAPQAQIEASAAATPTLPPGEIAARISSGRSAPPAALDVRPMAQHDRRAQGGDVELDQEQALQRLGSQPAVPPPATGSRASWVLGGIGLLIAATVIGAFISSTPSGPTAGDVVAPLDATGRRGSAPSNSTVTPTVPKSVGATDVVIPTPCDGLVEARCRQDSRCAWTAVAAGTIGGTGGLGRCELIGIRAAPTFGGTPPAYVPSNVALTRARESLTRAIILRSAPHAVPLRLCENCPPAPSSGEPPDAALVACAKPFARIADLKGRKVRVAGGTGGELLGRGLTAAGGVPVVLPFPEVALALSSGVVDCAAISLAAP